MQREITISTGKREEIIDITNEVEKVVTESGIKLGICSIFAPHATGAITINENADPNICDDILESLKENIPQGKWRHDRIDNNADAHIKSSILGPSETVPIKDSKLILGTWQNIFFAELDGPKSKRRIVITTMGD